MVHQHKPTVDQGSIADSLLANAEGEKVSGTCEKIGFIDFSTTYFQCFTQLITGPNSIFSHVPGTF
jgi:hypothetical protein